uniref:Branched-chain-amino-acid aminotransferase n=1 Tax=Meloidogyne enterolobii TaxID=390850 RepID=A0A6V7V715_MELEN|nr:unnamed protein product [Meloidogyne enterolobii]
MKITISVLKPLLRSGTTINCRRFATALAVEDNLIHQKQPLIIEEDNQKYTFYHKDLQIERAEIWQMQDKPDKYEQLKFGHHYADHMIGVDWSEEKGWSQPQITPVSEIRLHPGAKVFHYAVSLFEGMKAYRGVDDRIRLFRPEMNISRMRKTAARSSLPDFDGDELLKIITELVRLDKEWVPYSSTASLYIRPTMIGTDPTLGVANPKNAKLFVLSGPVGSFYSTGFNPVSLFADPSFVRAFPGGVGSFKMGCNYAPTIMLGKIASEFGCQQVLWLSGEDQKLTEVGSMNIFLYWINEEGEKELITPPLDDGLILPGIVRESVLTLVREWDEFKVSESYPTIAQMKKAIAEKRLLQIFGTGTAVALVPVGRIVFRNQETNSIEEFKIPTMNSGATVMQRLYETIIDIQQGRRDRPEWIYVID